MRPTFQLDTNMDPDVLIKRVRLAVSNAPLDYVGQFARRQAMISIHPAKRHFWSPWLHLDVRTEDTGNLIACRFSPHPSIWTGFVFSYLAIGVLVFFCLVLGVSQQIAGQPPWAYYGVPLGAAIATGMWFAAQAGQKLADDEMVRLKSLIELGISQDPSQGAEN
jgi:hypothetical protein